jgi:hypothetical protein
MSKSPSSPSPSLVTAPRLGRDETIRGLLPGFEDNETATKRQKLMCGRCEKGNDAEQKVGQRIAGCRKSVRCESGACDLCLKLAREQIVPQANTRMYSELKLAQSHWKKIGRALGQKEPKLLSVTAVDYRLATPRGQLDAAVLNRRAEALATALGRSAILSSKVIFGGWDFSLNFPIPVGGGDPMWMPHFYMLMVGTRDEVKPIIGDMFPSGPGVDRPVKVNEVCCIPGAVSYAIKSQFVRRTSYVGNNGRKATRITGLKSDEKRELAVLLDALGIGARFILKRLKITKGRLTDA